MNICQEYLKNKKIIEDIVDKSFTNDENIKSIKVNNDLSVTLLFKNDVENIEEYINSKLNRIIEGKISLSAYMETPITTNYKGRIDNIIIWRKVKFNYGTSVIILLCF